MKNILFIILLLGLFSSIYAQTDSLIFSKSEVVIGEIKSLKFGVLKIETAYSENDFEVEWIGVKEIYSKRVYIISSSDGKRIIGTINTDPNNKENVIIVTETSDKIYTIRTNIVYIQPLDSGFWDQLSVSIDIGFTYTKANNVKQLSISSALGYLTDNWQADLSYDEVRNSQDSVAKTQRTDIMGSYAYFLGKNWFVIGAVSFLQNDEQKLELRSTPKIGLGNYVIQTNHVYLGLQGGAAWNSEKYTDPAIENRSDAEAYIGLEYNMFDYSDLSLLTNLYGYKTIDGSDRYRADFKIDIKYDLPYDFYVKLGYTLNYDSVPVEGASESDYVLQTTFGWEL